MAARDDWMLELTEPQVRQIENAAEKAEATGKQTIEITREDFPLGAFTQTLASVADELEHGRGFVVLRGLPIENYSVERLGRIYWGLGVHLGIPVSQNARSDMVVHVRAEHDGGHGRFYNTNADLGFHADASDVVGLLCIRPAMSGGESTIASAIAVHDEMMLLRPDLVELLYQPLPGTFYMSGEHAPGAPPYYYTAPFSYFEGKLNIHWYPQTDQVAGDYPEVGIVAPEFFEAKNLFNELAIKYSFNMGFQPGDIQLLNNYSIVHARQGFIDYPEPERRRDLLRLWITLHNGRRLANNFSMNNGALDQWGGRGGFRNARSPISL
jgi:hypothetical protein